MVERARAGSDDALTELFRRHGGRVVRFAQRRTGSAAAADDIAVESFERAWRSLGDLRDPDHFVGWLLRIAARTVVDRARSESRRRGREERADAADAPLRVAADPADEFAAGGERDDALRAAIDRLSPVHQEVIMLRFHADLSPADAARALDISASAAGVRLHRAMTALRTELGVVDTEGAGRP